MNMKKNDFEEMTPEERIVIGGFGCFSVLFLFCVHCEINIGLVFFSNSGYYQ